MTKRMNNNCKWNPVVFEYEKIYFEHNILVFIYFFFLIEFSVVQYKTALPNTKDLPDKIQPLRRNVAQILVHHIVIKENFLKLVP